MIKLLTSSKSNKWKLSRIPKWLQSKRIREHDEMVVQIKELQVTSSEMLGRIQSNTEYDTNTYITHADQTNEIINKYQGVASYGVTLVKRLVNVAAALQVPNGIELNGDSKLPEYEYLKKFLDVNQLNEGVAIQLAKEAQFEGQVLLELVWDETDSMVKIRHNMWRVDEYQVHPIGVSNLTGPYEAVWMENEEVTKQLSGDNIAFVAFNATRNSDDYIEGWPTLGSLLMRLDTISRDLNDWRTTNKLFAHPTPVFECETQDEVDALTAQLTSTGWTVGTAIAFRGKFLLVASGSYYLTFRNSIETNVKLVSGGSGVSIAWLGFADVMSNRATAESLGEPLEIVSAADIATWSSFYEEIFNSVIELRNLYLDSNQKLKPGIIKPKLKPMSDRQWQKLKELFMPAAKDNLLTRQAFLEQIPNFDITAELERIAEEASEMEIDLDLVEDIESEEE